jgi:hypothetical protein
VKPKLYLHIVWSPTVGPLYGYWLPQFAHDHARTMVGVDVGAAEIREEPDPTATDARAQLAAQVEDVKVSPVVVLERLPDFVLDDFASDDYANSDDVTPVELDDIDDKDP